MKLVECKNLQKTYGSGETAVRALGGVDLCIERGEFTAIVGASGVGKINAAAHSGQRGQTNGRQRAGRRRRRRQPDAREGGAVPAAQGRAGLPVFQPDPNVDGGEKHRPAAAAGQTQGPTPHGSARWSAHWACRTNCRRCRASFPAGSSSGWPLPARCATGPPCCWPTNPPATWTAGTPPRSGIFCSFAIAIFSRRSCW